eukprot:1156138-Pelagomonas_calceolata.AAC.12
MTPQHLSLEILGGHARQVERLHTGLQPCQQQGTEEGSPHGKKTHHLSLSLSPDLVYIFPIAVDDLLCPQRQQLWCYLMN